MALIPLNTFKTKTANLGTNSTATVYTAPVGTTAIILMAQISNISTTTQVVSFAHHRNIPILQDAQGNGAQPGNVDTFLAQNFEIPPNDAASILTGKLIVETLDSIRCYATNSGTTQLVLSVLETANS